MAAQLSTVHPHDEPRGPRWSSSGVVALLILGLMAAACGRGEAPGAAPAADAKAANACARQHFVAQDTVLCADGRSPARFPKDVVAPLIGYQAPQAVPSADGRYVLYNAWDEKLDLGCRDVDPAKCPEVRPEDVFGRPSLWLADMRGCDFRGNASSKCATHTLFEDGAVSAAWRRDGTVAFFKGSSPDVPARIRLFRGHIFSRALDPSSERAASGEDVQLTVEEDAYLVVAWAGTRLLAYRQHLGDEGSDVIVVDAPGEVRVLQADADIIAISPDGSKVVTVQPQDDPSLKLVRVVDIATGETLHEVDTATELVPGTSEPIGRIAPSGSWKGERIVAEAADGIMVWRWDGSGLVSERRIPTGLEESGWGAHFPSLDEDGDAVVSWVPMPKRGASYSDTREMSRKPQDVLVVQLSCSVKKGACQRAGRPVSADSFVVSANWSVG